MLLRHKFGFLALIYAVSIFATLAISGWCIAVYFQSAFSDYQSSLSVQDGVEQLRVLVRRQYKLFTEEPPEAKKLEIYDYLQSKIASAMSHLGATMGSDTQLWKAIQQAAERKDHVAARILGEPGGSSAMPKTTNAVPNEVLVVFEDLDQLLMSASGTFSLQRERSVEKAAATQQRVVTILVVNAMCAVSVGFAGTFLLWRWVVRPVSELRTATKEIGRGNLSYRVISRSSDELGQLAGDVNEMSSTISQMQTDLIQQERLAAAGEMVGRIAHNIRNPLSGIRGLAETSTEFASDEGQVRTCQGRIVAAVDQFEQWLRNMEQTISPMNLDRQPTSMIHMIDSVVRAVQPLQDQLGVNVERAIQSDLGPANVDRFHLEQALVALLTNAIQASSSGQTVRISVNFNNQQELQITMQDSGIGIPKDLHQKVFQPYFTTRKNGTGVGLALADRVVAMHGGRLVVDSEPGKGTTFDAILPCSQNGDT